MSSSVEFPRPIDGRGVGDYQGGVDHLDLLCCPETRQPLRIATPGEIARLAAAAEAALIREDGRVAYPIRNGIPLLLVEERIALKS